MRVGTKAPLPKKPRVLKTCARHPLRQIVYDDHDEVDYTNRVPRLRPVSNEIRRTSLLVEHFRRSGGTRFVYPTSSENDVVVLPIPRPSPHHQHCPPFQTHHPHHTPRLFLLLILILGRWWPSTRAHLFSSPHPNPRSMVALDLRSSFLQPVHSFPACLNSTIAI